MKKSPWESNLSNTKGVFIGYCMVMRVRERPPCQGLPEYHRLRWVVSTDKRIAVLIHQATGIGKWLETSASHDA